LVDGRHTFTAGLWVISVVLVALGLVRFGPVIWANLFPGIDRLPANSGDGMSGGMHSDRTPPTPEQAAEALHRVLANWEVGYSPELDTIYLPDGRRPRELQDTLRGLEPLADLEVYVTRVDDLLFRLRIFSGKQLLLQREVFPWLPERPTVSGVNPPEAGFLVILGGDETDVIDEICRWRAPLAVALPPFAAHAVKSVRMASRCSKGVVLLLDPDDDVAEQLATAPEASGVLLEKSLAPDRPLKPWLQILAERDVFLLDGRPSGSLPSLQKAAAELGVPYVQRAGHLAKEYDFVLARNLTIRRGYGLISADASEEGIQLLSDFIESAQEDGYSTLFPAEVARAHRSSD